MINFDKGGNIQFGTESGMQFTQPVETGEIWNQANGNYKQNSFIPNGVSGNDLDLTINNINMTIVNSMVPISDNNQIFINNGPNLFAISLDGSSINWSQSPTDGENFRNLAPGLVGDVIFMIESADFPNVRFVIYDKLTGDEIDSRLVDVGEGGFDENFIIQNDLLYQKEVAIGSEYFAYDPSTLTRTVLISAPESTFSSIAHSDDNIFAIDDDEGAIFKFDFSGNPINSISANVVSTAAISPDNNFLITVTTDITAFNTDTLDFEWVSNTSGRSAIDNDIIYGITGDILFRLNLSDGILIDFVNTGNNLGNIAVTSDTIYMQTSEEGENNKLLGYNKDDLSQIFQLELNQTTGGGLCITESSIVTFDSELNTLSVIT